MIKIIKIDKEKFNNKLDLEISLKSGNLTILSEENREDTIDIDFEDLRKGTAEDIFEVELDKVEKKLIIREKKKGSFPFNNISSSFSSSSNITIYLPKNLAINSSTKCYSGNIKITDCNISGEITCYNGNIKFKNVITNCDIKIFNGNLGITDGIIKFLKTKCFSGNIKISSIFDIRKNRCLIQTLAGNIKIESKEILPSDEIIEIKTLTGNIKIADNLPQDKIRISKKIDFEKNEFIKSYVPELVKGILSNLSENFSYSSQGKHHHKNKNKNKENHDDIEVEVNENKSKTVSKSEHIESVLKMVSDGKISVGDAEKLIKALG